MRIVAKPSGKSPKSATRTPAMYSKLLPLGRNALVRREGIPGGEASNEQLVEFLETRFVQGDQQRFVHANGLHELEMIKVSERAAMLGRHAELFTKCARERFM